MKIAGIIIIIGILFAGVMWSFNSAYSKVEKAECEKLALQAEAYEQFYLVKWQKDMCDARGVIINAPVK